MALDTLIKDKNLENVKVWEFLGGLFQFCCVLSVFNVSETFKWQNIVLTWKYCILKGQRDFKREKYERGLAKIKFVIQVY